MTALDDRALTGPVPAEPGLTDLGARLRAFARANGGEYFLHTIEQPLPGVIFRDARGRPRPGQAAGSIVRFPGPPLIEVANAMYVVPLHLTLFSHLVRAWGYAALHLPRTLPSLLLESSRVRAERRLPVPRGSEGAPLQGTHGAFTLHAPGTARTFAQALLTPEVLDALDDGIFAFDLEVAGSWLFLYRPGQLATADPRVWQRILAALDALRARPALGLGAV